MTSTRAQVRCQSRPWGSVHMGKSKDPVAVLLEGCQRLLEAQCDAKVRMTGSVLANPVARPVDEVVGD